jgi:hypothetical protein
MPSWLNLSLECWKNFFHHSMSRLVWDLNNVDPQFNFEWYLIPNRLEVFLFSRDAQEFQLGGVNGNGRSCWRDHLTLWIGPEQIRVSLLSTLDCSDHQGVRKRVRPWRESLDTFIKDQNKSSTRTYPRYESSSRDVTSSECQWTKPQSNTHGVLLDLSDHTHYTILNDRFPTLTQGLWNLEADQSTGVNINRYGRTYRMES